MTLHLLRAGKNNMHAGSIRPIAICVCSHDSRILVAEGYDHKKRQSFFRPLGGTIEFGERGEETVCREFKEEIGADLIQVHYLGLLENIFTYEGQAGHEIVLVYDGQLVDPALYDQEVLQGDEFGKKFKAVWKRLDEFGPENPPIYPEGIIDMIRKCS